VLQGAKGTDQPKRPHFACSLVVGISKQADRHQQPDIEHVITAIAGIQTNLFMEMIKRESSTS